MHREKRGQIDHRKHISKIDKTSESNPNTYSQQKTFFDPPPANGTACRDIPIFDSRTHHDWRPPHHCCLSFHLSVCPSLQAPVTLSLKVFSGRGSSPNPCLGQTRNASEVTLPGSHPQPATGESWRENNPAASPLNWDSAEVYSTVSPSSPKGLSPGVACCSIHQLLCHIFVSPRPRPNS